MTDTLFKQVIWLYCEIVSNDRHLIPVMPAGFALNAGD